MPHPGLTTFTRWRHLSFALLAPVMILDQFSPNFNSMIVALLTIYTEYFIGIAIDIVVFNIPLDTL